MAKTDILVINPGSTSTKLGVYRNMELLFETTIRHDPDKLLSFGPIPQQKDYRIQFIQEMLQENNYDLGQLKAVVARGGNISGLHSGGYLVNEDFCIGVSDPEIPQHACNLGAPIAYSIAQPLGIPAYIYDSPIGTDLTDVAKVSGFAGIERVGLYHVLNSRAQAINYAEQQGREYKDLSVIVCHLGGGITVTVHKDGKIIDGVSYDDGPMAPERTGGIPLLFWNKLCLSGKYTLEELEKLVCGKGGLYSYLGTTDCRAVEQMIADGNEEARLLYEAMAYQVAKGIATASVALKGKMDTIIITGGIAHSKMLTGMIMDYAAHIGPFTLMPGEDELFALASGANRILEGKEEASVYHLPGKEK
ncbi:MAG: butyrate kinase [Firmicutes bacterium]|nr:butyrate kinase [Bacillota bacterium]